MRRFVVWAAMLVASLCAGPARAATYASDAAYQYTGQNYATSGRGLAVNAAESRLFAVNRKSAGGNIQVCDLATKTWLAPITLPSPTTVNDIALSPDGSKLFIARVTVAGSEGEIDVANAVEGAPASTAFPLQDGTPPPDGPLPLGVPLSLAVTASGTTQYVGVATNSGFYIYTQDAGGPWVQQTALVLPFSTSPRRAIVQDSANGPVFLVLTASSAASPNIRQITLDGTMTIPTWDPLPETTNGYTIDSIIAGGEVDGVPSVFVAADTTDNLGNAALTVFRYDMDGVLQGDGFGFGLSTAAPLSTLQPLDTAPPFVPGVTVNHHVYLGAIDPNQFGGGDQTVRVVVTNSTIVNVNVSGTVLDADNKPVAGAKVVIGGKNSPTATTGADGTYTLVSVAPTHTLKVGASRYGYIAATAVFDVPAGADKTGANLTLPGTVQTFSLNRAFAPIIPDGSTFAGEYNATPMPFTLANGVELDPALRTTAYAQWDGTALYIAVVGLEPSIELNSALYGNQNMLTRDDNIQIFVDPPHRHDVPGSQGNLFQFAINLPAPFNGEPSVPPLRFQRRVTSTGTQSSTLPSSAWAAHMGYTAGGFVVEAQINTSMLSPFAPPAANAEWGILIARHRPTSHLDNRSVDFTSSNAQGNSFYEANTWTDVRLAPAPASVPGDVNDSGAVDFVDAVYALRMAGGLEYGRPTPGDPVPDPDPNGTIRVAVVARGDVWPAGSPDGKITLEDALRLFRAASGLDTIH